MASAQIDTWRWGDGSGERAWQSDLRRGGGAFGRWFGIFAGALAAIAALLAIPAYPLLFIGIFALSVWIVYGLVVYGEDIRAAGQ